MSGGKMTPAQAAERYLNWATNEADPQCAAAYAQVAIACCLAGIWTELKRMNDEKAVQR